MKKKHEEHVNHERWLVSYADFITLLFAFFTVLYATAQTDQAKLEAVLDSLNAAFNGGMPHTIHPSRGVGTTNVGLIEPHLSVISDTTTMVESMRRGLRGSLSDNVVQIGLVNQKLTIVLPEKIAFATGSATLHPNAFGVLSEVAAVVKDVPARINVIGHADSTPVKPGTFYQDNWGLAGARAVAAARYLERRGLPTHHIVATAEVSEEAGEHVRSLTIEVDLDHPSLGATVANELQEAGLVDPAK